MQSCNLIVTRSAFDVTFHLDILFFREEWTWRKFNSSVQQVSRLKLVEIRHTHILTFLLSQGEEIKHVILNRINKCS